jgi:hypothetical protein
VETLGKIAFGALVGVGLYVGYEHYASAKQATPGPTPTPGPAPAPGQKTPAPVPAWPPGQTQPANPFPNLPPQLSANGHSTISANQLADEAFWAVLDLSKMTNAPQLGSWTQLTQTYILTNAPGVESDPGFQGYASTWGPQMSAQNHTIFVAPSLLSTTPGSRVVALDQAPPTYLQVTA